MGIFDWLKRIKRKNIELNSIEKINQFEIDRENERENIKKIQFFTNPGTYEIYNRTRMRDPNKKVCPRCNYLGDNSDFKSGKALKKYQSFGQGSSVFECPKCGAVWRV